MNIQYSPELLEHMQKTGNTCVLVELVEVTSSDLEITELHVRFADPKTRSIFLEKKGYRIFNTEVGEVLLPPYPLTFEDTVEFGLKKFLFLKWLSHKGIKV